jgi:CheY-like chemotaxis protein
MAPDTMRVLLAEDDSAMRALLARALRKSGFEVLEASTGQEALERLSGHWWTSPSPRSI